MQKIVVGWMLTLWMGLAVAATPRQGVLHVENLTCPACRITIDTALDKVPGVTSRLVNIETATVTVMFDAERTTVAAVAQAITEAGFPATARTSDG